MKPVHFVFVCLMLAGTPAPTQSGSISLANQLNGGPNMQAPHPGMPWNFSQMPKGGKFAQRGTRALRGTGGRRATQQDSGLDFANAVTYYSSGAGADSIVIADVNGDGKPDLVVANSCTDYACTGSSSVGNVSVLLGNGDGTFQTAISYAVGGFRPTSVAMADVNGDGKLDALVASFCGDINCDTTDGVVSVLLGNGDGTFQAPATYDAGGYSTNSVAIADVNADGKPDILLANDCGGDVSCSSEGTVGVLLNNGDGTFQTAVLYSSSGYRTLSVAAADVNGDGKPDIILTNGCGVACDNQEPDGTVGILLNNGDGTFQPAVTYDSGAYYTWSVAAGDLNGDHKIDLAVTSAYGGLGVLIGNGDGTFQTVVSYNTGGITPAGVEIADVNGDDKPDILVVNGDPDDSVAVFLGNGNGTFQKAVTYGSGGGGAGAVSVGDLNGDGKPDLAVANGCDTYGCLGQPTGVVGVLINTSQTVDGPLASFSPTSLSFGAQNVGASSTPQATMLTNTGNVNLSITSIQIAGTNSSDFAQTNGCPSSLSPGKSCKISVTYTPTGGGLREAELKFTDNAPGSPQAVALTGAVHDFSLAVTSQTSLTVTPGQAANYAIAVSPVNGFAQKVVLSCSGAPAESTCTISPSSVTLNGTASVPADVAVVTSGTSAGLAHPPGFPPAGIRSALWLAFPGMSGLVLLGSRPRKWQVRVLFGLASMCLLLLLMTWPACGGSGSGAGGTPAGTYNLTLTGTFTSGTAKLAHNMEVALVVK